MPLDPLVVVVLGPGELLEFLLEFRLIRLPRLDREMEGRVGCNYLFLCCFRSIGCLEKKGSTLGGGDEALADEIGGTL